MTLELKAVTRDRTGKGAARGVRRDQNVPAVLYGPKTQPTPLTVSAMNLEKLLKETGGESKLLNLNVEGDRTRQVLIREIQTHPYRRRFVHVDFYEVPLDQPITVEVLVELVGDAIGVQKGGELNLIQRTLAVKCLPNQIPESIPIDVSKLDMGEMLHVGDLVAGPSYEFEEAASVGVVSVVAPEAAPAAEEEAPPTPPAAGK